jgi:hypothetical protein
MLQRFFVRQVRAFRFAESSVRFLVLVFLFGSFGFRVEVTNLVSLFVLFLVQIFRLFFVVFFVERLFFGFLLVELRPAGQVVRIRASLRLFVLCLDQPRRKRRQFLFAQARGAVAQWLAYDLLVDFLHVNVFVFVRFRRVDRGFFHGLFTARSFRCSFVVR